MIDECTIMDVENYREKNLGGQIQCLEKKAWIPVFSLDISSTHILLVEPGQLHAGLS